MKSTISKLSCIIALLYLTGCSKNEPAMEKPSDFTGNEVTYALASGSAYSISGTAIFKERKDGFTTINISLNGIDGGKGAEFPVHLHFGDISKEKANVASLLQPVDGATGKSETILKQLADESSIKFSDLKALNACIKIHLSATGDGANVILSAGNVGSAVTSASTSGRLSIGICKSE